MKTRKATGLLGKILSNMDEKDLAKTRNRMLIAAKIASSMESNGLNQKQFAKKMGKTESEVSEWLSGDRNFTIDTLTEIENVLGVSLLNVNNSKYNYSTKVEKMTLIIPLKYNHLKDYKSFIDNKPYCIHNLRRNEA